MSYTIEGLIAMVPTSFQVDQAKGVNTSVQLNVTGSQAGQWNAVIKDGAVTVNKGVNPSAEISVTADTDDILAVAEGKLDPAKALMTGKAKVKGDMTEIMKLLPLFKR
ncbi:MAG: SCP2 sterol-binding domain-containing protein [Anaerolineales bacterium]|nr:SCP2 sterol-binding domain-containing protein [Anaerolineales bacterium]